MEEHHRNALMKCLPSIVRDLDTLPVCIQLVSTEFLSYEEVEEIRAETRSDERNYKLVAKIQTKGPLAFQGFIDALDKKNQRELKKLILSELRKLNPTYDEFSENSQSSNQSSSSGTSAFGLHDVPNDKLSRKYYATANQAFDELMSKYFKHDHFQYKTFKNWKIIARQDDIGGIIYRCSPQPPDEPHALFGLKTVLDAPAELLFKDLLSNIDLEPLENPLYESMKRIEWLGKQSDIIHGWPKDYNILCTGRDIVIARQWRKVNDSYIICGRSIETDKVPPRPDKIRYDARFAASRYTPMSDNKNQCVYEALVSGDPKGWVSSSSPLRWVYDSVLGRLIMSEIHLQRKKVERINKCLRSDCKNQGAKMCIYCKNIYDCSNSIFL